MKVKAWYIAMFMMVAGIGYGLFQAANVFYAKTSHENPLTEAFGFSEATVVEININCYASDCNRFWNREEVTKTADSLARELGLKPDSCERVENFHTGYNQLSLLGKNTAGYTMAIIVHSMDFAYTDEGAEGVESDIVVDVSLGADMKALQYMDKKVKTLIKEYITGARSTSCIVGSFDKNISMEEMENITDNIFESLGAKEVERTRYNNFLSVSAYTPYVDDYIEMGRNKINLNIAMRYSSYEDKTYIWLGSPVIALEY